VRSVISIGQGSPHLGRKVFDDETSFFWQTPVGYPLSTTSGTCYVRAKDRTKPAITYDYYDP